MTSQITNHVARALARLPSQHADKVNLAAFVTVLADAVQQAEDGIYPLLTDRTIDTAIGEQLDIIGRIVLEERAGLTDDAYRLRLKARIATNRSEGTLEELLNIVALILLPDVGQVNATMHFPAAIIFEVASLSVPASLADVLIKFLRDGASAGVRVQLITSTVADSETLYTSVSTYLTVAAGIGVGSLTVDDTAKFPASGSLDLSTGLAGAETVAYSSKTATSFTLIGVTANAHPINTDCALVGSLGKGLGNTDVPSEGGDIASVEEI